MERFLIDDVYLRRCGWRERGDKLWYQKRLLFLDKNSSGIDYLFEAQRNVFIMFFGVIFIIRTIQGGHS